MAIIFAIEGLTFISIKLKIVSIFESSNALSFCDSQSQHDTSIVNPFLFFDQVLPESPENNILIQIWVHFLSSHWTHFTKTRRIRKNGETSILGKCSTTELCAVFVEG